MKRFLIIAALTCLPGIAVAQQTAGGHFIENWDLNTDGSVTLDEITERRGDVFAMFDQNEDNVLSAEEYVLFDETRAADMAQNASDHAPGKGGGRMQEGLTLDFNDTDNDGQVSRDEFLARSDAWFVMIDRNGDAAVTSQDFGPRSN